jgi:hypothetical protein
MPFSPHEDECDSIPPPGTVSPQELRMARINIAAATAVLPITPEMAWAVPQLLKRLRLLAPDVVSTNGVLRSLVRAPALDEQFSKALIDSGFLSCDEAIARSRWKFDLEAMLDKERSGSAALVLEHCRDVLSRRRTGRPVDWETVLDNLRTLRSWFPELRTIVLLERLYTRLHALQADAVLVAQAWLDLRACPANAVRAPTAVGRLQ